MNINNAAESTTEEQSSIPSKSNYCDKIKTFATDLEKSQIRSDNYNNENRVNNPKNKCEK